MEWLTTGQMIDRLKVGEVAERKFDNQASCSDRFTMVKLNEQGSLMAYDSNDDEWELTNLYGYLIESKWRILPKYVTFEEAIKAMQEGKMVYFHEGNSRINAHEELTLSWFKKYEWQDLICGKWTIGE